MTAMLSESARAASAAEARFRINDANSRPRAIKVIALDRPSETVVKRLAQLPWTSATFLTAVASVPPADERFSVQGWLGDLAGHTKDLIGEINSADLVVMVASDIDAALSQTLAQLRPWALMVVIASAEEYIADMLAALRA